MSILRNFMETVVRLAPEKEAGPRIPSQGYVGKPLSRVDGPAKVAGQAHFTAEFKLDNLAHAALVYSTIAKGRVTRIDTAAAEQAPGVIAIVTHTNAPGLKAPSILDLGNIGQGFAASNLPILQDTEVHWDGQPLAVVVAETLEQAEHAAWLVRAEYEQDTASVSFDAAKGEAVVPAKILTEEPQVEIGDAGQALSEAPFKVDHRYRTPRHNQNAIEPHATIATWDDGRLTVFDATQFVNGYKHTLAQVFDLDPQAVRVISPFVGGGFGGKAPLWNHTVLCAAAAKVVNRPVKLVLSREGVFRVVGGRTLAEQRVALGANEDGQFTAFIHNGTTATTTHAEFTEQFSLFSRHLYASKNFFIGQKIVNLDTVANTWMRAPGESIGTFALESAIDELAYAMQIDPIELRRINEPDNDPTTGREFSSRNLLEAYRRGAEAFGWSSRVRQPRSQRDGPWLYGQGVATAYYPVFRFPGTARIRIYADGTAAVQAAGSEMGMGTATAQIQYAAERLGLPIDMVSFQYGDSALPDGPILAAGSSQTMSIAAAVDAAAGKVHHELLNLASDDRDSPLAGTEYSQTQVREGGVFRVDDGRGESYSAILQRAGQEFVEAEATSSMPTELMEYSMGSYGAQFCEVRVNEESGEVRVTRWLGSFDCGRIVNPKTAISQLRGGIIMGIGMALTEATLFDERTGRIMNPSLAEYHVPVHLDVPRIDVIYNDIPDDHTPVGARGVGEIGITGAAAAVANAVFHATGTRIRELPITLDTLL